MTRQSSRKATMIPIRVALPVLLIALAAACGGKKEGGGGGGDCKPLTVTVGGEPMTGLGHGLGIVEGGNYSVTVFDHDKVTCDELLAKSRQTSPDEDAVSAGLSSYGAVIGYNSNGKVGNDVDVKMTAKPAKAGDRIAMCVNATLPIKNGEHAGKDLVATGLLEGKFCGERK